MYLKGQDLGMDASGCGNSLVGVDEEDYPYYYMAVSYTHLDVYKRQGGTGDPDGGGTGGRKGRTDALSGGISVAGSILSSV